MPHAIVVQPPPGNLTGPFAGPAYLKAYAQDQGYDVRIYDAGIDAFRHLTTPQQLSRLIEQADSLCGRLEAKGVLDPLEQRWYGLLLMAKGFGLNPQRLQEAVAGFKDEKRFYEYAAYKIDCKVLDAYFRVLRAVFYPTMITPWDYPSVNTLKTADAIRLHLDDTINPYVVYYREVLIPEIAKARPGVIGISMVYATQSVQALVLGMLLKEQFPEIHITMGGSYLTQWALLMDEAQLALLFSATDSVICGEGEIPFVEVLDWYHNGAALAEVPNLIYREKDDGPIRQFETLVFTDLTEQPSPDFSDLDLTAYLIPEPVLPYMLTRGCYWQRCGFCQNGIGEFQPRPYQFVPVDNAIAELSTLAQRHACRHFHFCGDVIDTDYLQQFSQSLLDTSKPIFWHTNLRAENKFSAKFCAQLAEAGLKSVAMGIESGCQKTLDKMDKGLDITTIGATLRHFYDVGVATQVTSIFGFPGESELEARMTVEFLKNHIDSISVFDVGLLLVLPGSAMHADPASFGVDVISYKQTRLMTPEPLWKAARRISLAAVNRLFEQLGGLEASSCLINDHPYAGALCANHTLLYFGQGPYILKRLRALTNIEHQKAHRAFGMDPNHQKVSAVQSKIPQLRFPYRIYRSPYRHERAHFATAVSRHQQAVVSGAGWDYLLDPINIPQQLDPQTQQVLAAIDGQRDLEAVLKHCRQDQNSKGAFFLIDQVLNGLVTLSDKI